MKLLKCLPMLLCLCCAFALEVTQEQVKELRTKAEQGNATAQFYLGFCYANGKGVPEDDAEAVKWYRKAADQGNALAQSNLGRCYDEGEGVPEDDAEAVKWYRKAADQGLAEAQHYLASCYGTGTGVPQDYVTAYMWYNLSQAQGNDFAKESKDLITKSMTKEQIALAQKLSREWLEKREKAE